MKIIAIGGDDIGDVLYNAATFANLPVQPNAIDEQFIKLSGKPHPHIVFVGTASGDNPQEVALVKNYYHMRLGSEVFHLDLTHCSQTKSAIRTILNDADALYVGGGDTRLMLARWAQLGMDKLLKEYAERGLILAGVSAGAICWFDWYDNSDYIGEDMSTLDLLPGLGFINGFCVPHYDNIRTARQDDWFDRLLMRRGISGYALDNHAALIFDHGSISFVSAAAGAHVHVWHN
jgi:dipeptidase E